MMNKAWEKAAVPEHGVGRFRHQALPKLPSGVTLSTKDYWLLPPVAVNGLPVIFFFTMCSAALLHHEKRTGMMPV